MPWGAKSNEWSGVGEWGFVGILFGGKKWWWLLGVLQKSWVEEEVEVAFVR